MPPNLILLHIYFFVPIYSIILLCYNGKKKGGIPVICIQPLKGSLKEHDFFGIMSLPGRVEDAALDSSGTDYEMVLLLYH